MTDDMREIDGIFYVEEMLLDPKRKALILWGIRKDLSGHEKKAELSARLKADEEELKEVKTAGEVLQFDWEDCTINEII